MEQFLRSLIECTVVMSVIAVVLLLLSRPLARWYSPRSLYILWIVVFVGLAIPFRPQSAAPALVSVPVPGAAAPATPVGGMGGMPPLTIAPDIQSTGQTFAAGLQGGDSTVHPAFPWTALLFGLWLAGTVGLMGWRLWRHFAFMRAVRRWSRPLHDQRYDEILAQEGRRLGIRGRVRILRCPVVDSPMLVGFFRPTILLPQETLPPQAMAMVLRHELVHLRRGDLWIKTLALAAGAVHWFNPLLPLMQRAMDFQCEAACDATVTQGAALRTRKVYSHTILALIRQQNHRPTAFSTSFHRGKRGVKRRLSSILDGRRKRLSLLLLCATLAVTLGSGMFFALGEEAPAQTQSPSDRATPLPDEQPVSTDAPSATAILTAPTATPLPEDSPERQQQLEDYDAAYMALQAAYGQEETFWTLEQRAEATALRKQYQIPWGDWADNILPGDEDLPQAQAEALGLAAIESHYGVTAEDMAQRYIMVPYFLKNSNIGENPFWRFEYGVMKETWLDLAFYAHVDARTGEVDARPSSTAAFLYPTIQGPAAPPDALTALQAVEAANDILWEELEIGTDQLSFSPIVTTYHGADGTDPAYWLVQYRNSGANAEKVESVWAEVTLEAETGALLSLKDLRSMPEDIERISQLVFDRLAELEAEKGPSYTWSLQDRADYALWQWQQGYTGWPDSMPGEGDLPLEEAEAIALAALAETYGFTGAQLESLTLYPAFYGGATGHKGEWNLLFISDDPGIQEEYGQLNVWVESPNGRVRDLGDEAHGNG